MRAPGIPFVLVVILLDVVGFGLIIPVLPALVAEFTTDRAAVATWYGLLVAVYAAMQFLAAPLLGALSDRFGRRPLLLATTVGLGQELPELLRDPAVRGTEWDQPWIDRVSIRSRHRRFDLRNRWIEHSGGRSAPGPLG